MYALDAKAVERDAVIRLDQEACIVSRCRRESTSKLKDVRCVGAQRVSRAGLQEAGGSRPDDPKPSSASPLIAHTKLLPAAYCSMKHYVYLTMSGTFSFHRLASSHRVLGQHSAYSLKDAHKAPSK